MLNEVSNLIFPNVHDVRSMNTFLIIYLIILLSEAILSTILKYAWQAEIKWNEPFYNQKTEAERNSSPVSLLCFCDQRNEFLLICFCEDCRLSAPEIRWVEILVDIPLLLSVYICTLRCPSLSDPRKNYKGPII